MEGDRAKLRGNKVYPTTNNRGYFGLPIKSFASFLGLRGGENIERNPLEFVASGGGRVDQSTKSTRIGADGHHIVAELEMRSDRIPLKGAASQMKIGLMDVVGNTALSKWFTFVDAEQQHKFNEFMRGDFEATLLSCFLVLFGIFYFPSIAVSFAREVYLHEEGSSSSTTSSDNSRSYYYTNRRDFVPLFSFTSVLLVISFILGMLILYLRVMLTKSKRRIIFLPRSFDRWLIKHDLYIERWFMLLCCFSQGLSLLSRSLQVQPCANTSFLAVLFCNPELNSNALPQDSAFAVVLGPCFLALALKGVPTYVTLQAWVISTAFLVISLAVSNSWERSGILILFAFVDGIRALILHRGDIMTFLSVLVQRKAMSMKMMADTKTTQAEEIRHMISNMAHDLKSPMQAFSNSMADLERSIGSVMIECTLIPDLDDAQKQLEGCMKVIEDMAATSQFMTMTINRALDYSRASHGIKLIPTYRSVDITGTLAWPIQCMRNLQDRVKIVVNPLPEDIFPYCITDGQWLQENILCVLSNAVKFSFGGTVEVTVTLVEEIKVNSPIGSKPSSPGPSFHKPDTAAVAADSSGRSISTRPKSKHSMLCFRVSDCGVGISPDAQETAFQPLKRSATGDRHSGGAGLGLYSLAKRVEALGGSCGIGPRKDGKDGALCWFTEPYRPDFNPTTIDGEPIDVSQNALERIRSRRLSGGGDIVSARLLSSNLAISGPQSPQQQQLFSRERRGGSRASSENHSNRETSILLSVGTVRSVPPLTRGHSQSSRPASVFVQPRSSSNSGRVSHRNSDGRMSPSRHSDDPQVKQGEGGKEAEESLVQAMESIDRGDSQHSKNPPAEKCGILVVDDSPTILKTMVRSLQNARYEVDTAPNGAFALEMMKVKKYDAVLMDIQMPVMDGIEAVSKLREHEKAQLEETIAPSSLVTAGNNASQFIIGVSANSDTGTSTKALEVGMNKFMPKPFTLETFERLLVGELSRRNSSKASISCSFSKGRDRRYSSSRTVTGTGSRTGSRTGREGRLSLDPEMLSSVGCALRDTSSLSVDSLHSQKRASWTVTTDDFLLTSSDFKSGFLDAPLLPVQEENLCSSRQSYSLFPGLTRASDTPSRRSEDRRDRTSSGVVDPSSIGRAEPKSAYSSHSRSRSHSTRQPSSTIQDQFLRLADDFAAPQSNRPEDLSDPQPPQSSLRVQDGDSGLKESLFAFVANAAHGSEREQGTTTCGHDGRLLSSPKRSVLRQADKAVHG